MERCVGFILRATRPPWGVPGRGLSWVVPSPGARQRRSISSNYRVMSSLQPPDLITTVVDERTIHDEVGTLINAVLLNAIDWR
jgi:hypothetical protein